MITSKILSDPPAVPSTNTNFTSKMIPRPPGSGGGAGVYV
jgi:hypothetical protein